MTSGLTSTHLCVLADALRRYQAKKAERQLADERMKAAFGEQAEGKQEELRFELIDTPAMTVAGG